MSDPIELSKALRDTFETARNQTEPEHGYGLMVPWEELPFSRRFKWYEMAKTAADKLLGPCVGCSTETGPEEFCPQHGRPYNDLLDLLDRTHKHTLNAYVQRSHQTAVDHGFWENERNFGEMGLLAVSEITEALDEHRSGKPAVYFLCKECTFATEYIEQARSHVHGLKNMKPEGIAVELVDAMIRLEDMIADQLKGTGYTVEDVHDIKMDYNDTRPYKHGRQY